MLVNLAVHRVNMFFGLLLKSVGTIMCIGKEKERHYKHLAHTRLVENRHRQVKSSNRVKTVKITGSNPDYRITYEFESTLI